MINIIHGTCVLVFKDLPFAMNIWYKSILILTPSSSRNRFPNYLFAPILGLGIIVFFVACPGVDVEDATPPSKPEWIQKSLPEEWPERGIDAHESGGIFLEWEPNLGEDIARYFIYRAIWFELADSLGEFELLTRLDTEVLRETSFLDEQIIVNQKYYYKLMAEDNSGNLSEYSDETSYSLLYNISAELLLPNGQNEPLPMNRNLQWGNYYYSDLEDYCLTILTLDNALIIRLILQPTNYTGELEHWRIPDTVNLISGSVYKWRIDMGADYVDGRESLGSESSWASFLYSDP